MSEPLRLSFRLRCPAARAFEAWTARVGQWWPLEHASSGQAGLEVVLEGRAGGRIYGRTPSGDEHDWGEVTLWEPPRRLGYLWHAGRARADTTYVEITFLDQGDATTRVEIEHRGWERLGAQGSDLREANAAEWRDLLPRFVAAAEKPAGPSGR